AVLGNGTPAQIEALGKFVETAGIAFQIQDDILNLVGEKFGEKKGVGEDIHEGKRTIMVLYTLKTANAQDKNRLLDILNKHTNEQREIEEAISIIQKYNSIEYAKKRAKELVDGAWKDVDKVLKPSEAKQSLKDFADFLVNRDI
ncbi:MAG: polyprenyl synthetase family protein, partial [Candidatus Diapherotrites archaeon]